MPIKNRKILQPLGITNSYFFTTATNIIILDTKQKQKDNYHAPILHQSLDNIKNPSTLITLSLVTFILISSIIIACFNARLRNR